MIKGFEPVASIVNEHYYDNDCEPYWELEDIVDEKLEETYSFNNVYTEQQMNEYAKQVAINTMKAYLQPYSNDSDDYVAKLAEIIIEETKA